MVRFIHPDKNELQKNGQGSKEGGGVKSDDNTELEKFT